MANRTNAAGTNGNWHPLRAAWEQAGPTVMRGTKIAQNWGIPVNPLVQKIAQATLKKEWITLAFISLVTRGKYDTVGLFALGTFAWEGFSRKCFNGKIWKVPVSLGPDNAQDPTYFNRFMNKFDISREVLELRISLLQAEQAQIQESIDGNVEAGITGLNAVLADARNLEQSGELSGENTIKRVDAVRRAGRINASADGGSPQKHGESAARSIQQQIQDKNVAIRGLQEQIGKLEQKKESSSQSVSIDKILILAASCWGLQKVPIIGGMASSIMTVALGVILGNHGYCWAISKEEEELQR